jgi:hypothetical protein
MKRRLSEAPNDRSDALACRARSNHRRHVADDPGRRRASRVRSLEFKTSTVDYEVDKLRVGELRQTRRGGVHEQRAQGYGRLMPEQGHQGGPGRRHGRIYPYVVNVLASRLHDAGLKRALPGISTRPLR